MVRSFAQIDFTLEGWDGADHLRAAAFRGEDAIAEQVALRPELDGMATTLTAVLLQRDRRVVLLHAGDSRGYLFRDRRLYQLSKDDTFVRRWSMSGHSPLTKLVSTPNETSCFVH
jgi:serine/threonine protein phosphatase PrpC